MIFAMKDAYETLTKYVCLCICAGMEAEGDDSFCKILLSPEKFLVDYPFPVELVIVDEQGAQILGYQDHYVQKTVFLKKDGRNTGKSSFVYACDDLAGHDKQRIKLSDDVSVRAY